MHYFLCLEEDNNISKPEIKISPLEFRFSRVVISKPNISKTKILPKWDVVYNTHNIGVL